MSFSDPIQHGLPHRAPFIFVDRVLAAEPPRNAVCEVVFASGTPFFAGHFPNHPLVPGVILTEALAQTAGIAAGNPGNGRNYHLAAIRQMKFVAQVLPEQTIRLEATARGSMEGLLQFEVRATVDGNTVAEGVVILAVA